MNGRDDEAWLDALLQRQLPSGLSDDGFREQLLLRLPPRERPVRRAFILGLSWLVAAATLWLTLGEAEALSSDGVGDLTVPCCLGIALIWYLADCLTAVGRTHPRRSTRTSSSSSTQ
jgi:hypothetical protein